jgi:CRP-like cAMP-binding protein
MEHHHLAPTGFAVPSDRAGLPNRADGVARAAAVSGLGASLADPLWDALLAGPALTLDEVQALSSLAQSRNVLAGQSVLSRCHTANALVALRRGEVALGFRTGDGTFRTERIVRGPAWLDLSSAWLSEPHAMDAQALGPASVVELPRDALGARLARMPGLAQRLIQGLSREVQALAVNTHELMHKDAPARLAQWLYQRCEPLADAAGQAMVRLHERKRDVASQLAITPETLSRLMRSFTRQGVIEVSGYRVRVIDPAALNRLAQA